MSMSVKSEILDTTYRLYHHEAGRSWPKQGLSGLPLDHWDAPDRPLKLRDVSFWRKKGGPIRFVESLRIELPKDDMDLVVIRAKDNVGDLENDFVRDYFLQPLKEIVEGLLAIDGIERAVSVETAITPFSAATGPASIPRIN